MRFTIFFALLALALSQSVLNFEDDKGSCTLAKKGNRLEITIGSFGKLNIQWPLYAQEDQPIQVNA